MGEEQWNNRLTVGKQLQIVRYVEVIRPCCEEIKKKKK